MSIADSASIRLTRTLSLHQRMRGSKRDTQHLYCEGRLGKYIIIRDVHNLCNVN